MMVFTPTLKANKLGLTKWGRFVCLKRYLHYLSSAIFLQKESHTR